jgi:Uncharacterized conserved protein (DUF2190)
MADSIPYKKPGEDISGHASAAITGARFLAVSGDRTSGPGLATTAEGGNYRVAHAGAGARAVGVSMYDAPINGKVGILVGGIVPVLAGAAIAAGAEVQSDATGQAITLAAGKSLGVCMSGVTGGNYAEVLLNV